MSANTGTENLLSALSEGMAEAVAQSGAGTVTVDARRRLPATGVVYGSDLVLTADHVVEREEDIRVWRPDGAEAAADLVGRDPGSDLAVLRVDGGALSTAEVAESGRVGQLVLALGRPSPGEIQASLGIVSAIGGPVRVRRGGMLERYYRTDAIPYPGFSGGPLIDTAGRVLGINTSGLSRGSSLTIPSAQAWGIAGSLVEHGRVRRGYLGVRSQPVQLPATQREALGRDQSTGLLLVGVEDDSPAANAGLLVGDILVALDGEPVHDIDALQARLFEVSIGEPTPVEVVRGDQVAHLDVEVGER